MVLAPQHMVPMMNELQAVLEDLRDGIHPLVVVDSDSPLFFRIECCKGGATVAQRCGHGHVFRQAHAATELGVKRLWSSCAV